MLIVDCRESEVPASEHDIAECERTLGYALPSMLKKQFAVFNGGVSVKSCFVDAEETAWSVGDFLPVATKNMLLDSDIATEVDLLRARGVSNLYLPFANDEGGEALCLHRETKAVWLVEHIHFAPPQYTELATSWSDFVGGLMTDDKASELGYL